MPGRWMIYSHDALGLGHVRRSLAIARSVLESHPGIAALLVTCSPLVDALPISPGLDYIKLPSARKLDNELYTPRSLPITPSHLRDLRAAVLQHVALHFRPDLLLVDKSPAGLMGELSGTLSALHDRSTPPRRVLGLRDILDQPERVVEEWRVAGLGALIERHYDEIWVYGDSAVLDVRTAYELPEPLAERVRYLGYLVPQVQDDAREAARRRFGGGQGPLALVTVGGGEDGERLIGAYLEAAQRGLLPRELRSVVVLGPCMEPGTQARLSELPPPGVSVERFVPDLAPAIAAADVAVCMAGYNTVCELMAARTPAVLVPRIHPRREQLLRARCLEERGLAVCLEPESLDPVRLAEAVRSALRRGRPHNGLPATDGLAQTARAVKRMLPSGPGKLSHHPQEASDVGGAVPRGLG